MFFPDPHDVVVTVPVFCLDGAGTADTAWMFRGYQFLLVQHLVIIAGVVIQHAERLALHTINDPVG